MPILIWLLIRMLRALVATGRLLLDLRVVRRLPWPYLRTLARRDLFVGFAAGSLALSLVLTLAGAVLPLRAARDVLVAATIAAGAGILSSWLRLLTSR